ncbi:ATP phosphoribosyltransferase regulatory subunit [Gammaproteobacteria bacterium]
MSTNNRWLLPEGVEELLPPEARRLEALRRRIVDLFDTWGYDLVVPPLIEYLDSLLIGLGYDLDRQTFKLIDPLTGRLLGIRADITPQVARIEAHRLRRMVPVRLCYLGPVLRTQPDAPGGLRNPLQVGIELYGHAGIESDLEVMRLMVETLAVAGLINPYLDLGHVGIYRGLVAQSGLSHDAEAALFDALQRKAVPELEALLASLDLKTELRTMLAALVRLHGGTEILKQAKELLATADTEVKSALTNLRALAEHLSIRLFNCPLHFDLGELRGYAYHTGVVFAAYLPGHGRAVAQGGRYDGVGAVFGHPRPATGFSADLKALLFTAYPPKKSDGIYAPALVDATLDARIHSLRAHGERVVQALPGQSGGPMEMDCSRELVWQLGEWNICEIRS